MKTVCIIQARLGSTRLPGKVLMDLGDHPVLAWVVRACQAASGIDKVVVATSTLDTDDPIVKWSYRNFVYHFRGSETDVLARFAGAAEKASADIILRVTADEPFIDPAVISQVVWLRKQTGAAYCSNVSPRTYPDGLDVECFTREALMAAHAEATREIDRDTVTQWIMRNQSRFPAECVINPIPGQQNERWVLDTSDDYEFCKAIVKRRPWYKGPPSHLNILAILDREPELRKLNASGVMNERFYQALADEPLYRRTYDRSQAFLERAEKVVPLAAQTFSKSRLQFPQPSPLFVTHGQGGVVWDVDGNEYVDLVSALLPNILGYRDPDVDAAIRRQVCAGVSFSLATELEARLAETLCRHIPCAEAVRFGKTGTDATTAAVRLARAHTGRDRVLICGGYHGWADWSIGTTDRHLGIPGAAASLSTRVPFGDLRAMEIYRGQFAAAIVEPESDPEYLRALREWCNNYNTVLIFDEIITGFRFHLGGAQALYGIVPDLATFGKSMANGMPLSAIVGRSDIMSRMEPPDNIFYSGTFFGETLSLAAAIATIDKLESDDVPARLRETGTTLAGAVQILAEKHGVEHIFGLKGHPSLIRLSWNGIDGATSDQLWTLFRREMIATGTLLIASHNVCAAHSKSDIARVLRSYDHTFGVIRDALDKGDVSERLGNAGTVVAGIR